VSCNLAVFQSMRAALRRRGEPKKQKQKQKQKQKAQTAEAARPALRKSQPNWTIQLRTIQLRQPLSGSSVLFCASVLFCSRVLVC